MVYKEIEKVIRENIHKHSLINRGERILVAYSGGPDSTALLWILHKLSKKMKFSLSGCYINHNIRPRAAKKEAEFCREFCKNLKIPFFVIEADIPKFAADNKMSIEEAGHVFRRKALAEAADKHDCTKIAVGHHLDDVVETVLFRLFRGTGPQGLQPIKPAYGKIIRPLYSISRSDVERFLEKERIPWILDRSNLKSEYSRNYIRNRIIPLIEKHFGPKYRSSIINFARIVSIDDDFLSEITRLELEKIGTITPAGKIIVDLSRFSKYDVCLRRRMIKQVLENISGQPGAGTTIEIERSENVAAGTLKATSLAGNIEVARDKEGLFFYKKKAHIRPSKLDVPGTVRIDEINSRINSTLVSLTGTTVKSQKGGNRINIDFGKVSLPLQIRSIKPGDSFIPLGMRGSKKIGDFLTDKKVSKYIRDEITVVADRRGIIWLVGYQIADRVKVDKTTRKVLQIEVIRRKDTGNA
jgi:tRNA(Ile)-lysidine synthase